MPETQPKVERILRMREIRTEYNELMKSIKNIKIKKQDAIRLNYPIDAYQDIELELTIKVDNLVYEMNTLRSEYDEPSDVSERNFVRMCPSEECRGFIEENWKCGLSVDDSK